MALRRRSLSRCDCRTILPSGSLEPRGEGRGKPAKPKPPADDSQPSGLAIGGKPATKGQARAKLAELRAQRAKLAADAPAAKTLDASIALLASKVETAPASNGAASSVSQSDPPGDSDEDGDEGGDDPPADLTGKLTAAERGAAGEGKGATAEREGELASNFLDPDKRRYPVKVKRDGKWIYDRDLLLAAARDARKRNPPEPKIADQADAIREREFPTKAADKPAAKPTAKAADKPADKASGNAPPAKKKLRWL
jgi:hypothetical protein